MSLLVSRTVCDGLASFGETVSLLVLGRQFLNFRPSFCDPFAFLVFVSTLGEVVSFLVLGRQFLNFRPSVSEL